VHTIARIKSIFFCPSRDRGRGGESTKIGVSRGGFDFRATTKIAKLFAVVHSQLCACAQKKSCRGPLGCSDAHTHRALPPEAAWAAVRTPNAKAVKSNLLAARVATPYYISTPWSLQRDVKYLSRRTPKGAYSFGLALFAASASDASGRALVCCCAAQPYCGACLATSPRGQQDQRLSTLRCRLRVKIDFSIYRLSPVNPLGARPRNPN